MSLMHYTNYYMADCSSRNAGMWAQLSASYMKQATVSHCLQPSTLYSLVNATNSLQAFLCAVFLQLSCRGFISTQVFDSSRYCILHKEEDGQKQSNHCKMTRNERRSSTHIPLESLVEPSLPMMRYSFLSSNWPLHWRLFANTRMEFSITWMSSSEQNILSLREHCKCDWSLLTDDRSLLTDSEHVLDPGLVQFKITLRGNVKDFNNIRWNTRASFYWKTLLHAIWRVT